MNINQNHYGSGDNIAGDKIINGVPQRHLNQNDAKNIADQIPAGSDVLVWSQMGNPESEIYAREIATYLHNSGYKIQMGTGTLSNWGYSVKFLREKYNVFVGNNPELLSQ